MNVKYIFSKFSLLPEHTKKRRAFGVVFAGTTNGKVSEKIWMY